MNAADLRAEAIAAVDALSRAHLSPADVTCEPSDRPGRSKWWAGGISIDLPDLLPDAPRAALSRLWLHMHAVFVGECVICDATLDLSADPQSTRSLWLLAPVVLTVNHREGCPAIFTADEVARWFDPRAFDRKEP